MTDDELDAACARLWGLLPVPVDDLAGAGLIEPAGLLIGNGLARVRGGMLTALTVAEQIDRFGRPPRFDRLTVDTDEQRASERMSRMLAVLVSWLVTDAATSDDPVRHAEALFDHARAGIEAVLGVSNRWPGHRPPG